MGGGGGVFVEAELIGSCGHIYFFEVAPLELGKVLGRSRDFTSAPARKAIEKGEVLVGNEAFL